MPFLFYYPDMFNQQNLQLSQPTYTSNNPSQILSISIPSINEFFGNLEKEFGENIFDEVKNKFLQENIDILDIFDLKEMDWQNLGVKIGLKIKIIREAEKYKKIS